MNIAILSDTRLPTNLSYAGHGLGRSLARIGTGLSQLGHSVTIHAAAGSFVDGCDIHVYDNEENMGRFFAMFELGYDAILDGTHQHTLAWLKPEWPIVCKIADGEGKAPRNRVWGNSNIPEFFGIKEAGIIIPEGVDIENIPFDPHIRDNRVLMFASAMHEWKKPLVAVEVAQKAGMHPWLLGEPFLFPADSKIAQQGFQAGHNFYTMLMTAKGMIYPVSSMAEMEAAATGTPSIVMMANDSWHEHGITGFTAVTIDEAVEATKHLDDLDKYKMREWVADNRSLMRMAQDWEAVLYRAANGETW